MSSWRRKDTNIVWLDTWWWMKGEHRMIGHMVVDERWTSYDWTHGAGWKVDIVWLDTWWWVKGGHRMIGHMVVGERWTSYDWTHGAGWKVDIVWLDTWWWMKGERLSRCKMWMVSWILDVHLSNQIHSWNIFSTDMREVSVCVGGGGG